MPDVPFLCDFRRSVELTPDAPFTELRQYLAVHRDQDDQTFATLSYFDGVGFARRASATARFSVALMDPIVLPSTVFAAYNAYGSAEKMIDVYPFNGHEGGQGHQFVRQARWLADRAHE
jgi:cephalosporin-C deacetylase